MRLLEDVGLKVIGFEAESETLVYLVVGASARKEREAGADDALVDVVLVGQAADASVAEHQFAEGGPALTAVKRELQAKEDVVFTSIGIEGGAGGASDDALGEWGRDRGRDLGVAEVFAAVDHKPDVVNHVDRERAIPSI